MECSFMQALVTKAARLAELVRRLHALPAARNHEEAKRQIDETLNAVEDELSGVRFDPSAWRTDGRMYPVQEDNASDVEGYPGVTSYRSFRHETFIGRNGAFEIRESRTGVIAVLKVGSDGKGVWQ